LVLVQRLRQHHSQHFATQFLQQFLLLRAVEEERVRHSLTLVVAEAVVVL
jgi:hypothetical protein